MFALNATLLHVLTLAAVQYLNVLEAQCLSVVHVLLLFALILRSSVLPVVHLLALILLTLYAA